MIITELLPTDMRFSNTLRIPFEYGILKDNIKELLLTITPEKDIMYKWYISLINDNIESGTCGCTIETNKTTLNIDTFIKEKLNTTKGEIIKKYKDIDNIKYETINAIIRYLEIIKEKRRLENLTVPKNLNMYIDYLSYNFNINYLRENINEICNGNYLNAIHDTEEKKLTHIGILKNIIEKLDLCKFYSNHDIKNIVDAEYDRCCPKIKYLYVACSSSYSMNNSDILIHLDRTNLICIKKHTK